MELKSVLGAVTVDDYDIDAIDKFFVTNSYDFHYANKLASALNLLQLHIPLVACIADEKNFKAERRICFSKDTQLRSLTYFKWHLSYQ